MTDCQTPGERDPGEHIGSTVRLILQDALIVGTLIACEDGQAVVDVGIGRLHLPVTALHLGSRESF